MYMGRKSLGQEITFTVSAVNAGLSSWPSDPPFLDVWAGATLVLHGLKLPKVENQSVGLFRLNVFLDSRFAVGRYEVVKRWTVGTYLGVEVDVFDVIPGGDADGAVISMFYHEMPQANFILTQLDSGKLKRSKNPRV